MQWIARVEGGPRRVNHTACVIGDQIYTFGGYCSNEDYHAIKTIDVHVLNTQTLRWSLVPPRSDKSGYLLGYPEVPFQRYGHTAVAYEHNVYMWGGRNDDVCCNILFCFNTHTHTWSKPEVSGSIPGVRDGHSACIVGNSMYIFGGFEEEINQFSCDVHCLNLETMEWAFVPTGSLPPSYRDFHTATVLNDRMYVFGGRGDRHSPYHTQEEIYCSKMVYLDLKTFQWHTPTCGGQIPIGRRSHSTVVYRGKLYMFGGYNSLMDRHFNELYSFDPDTNVWQVMKTVGVPPQPRRRQVCLVLGQRMYLFGGTRYVWCMAYDGDEGCFVNRFIFFSFSPCEIPDANMGSDAVLWDYNDLHVLDFAPTLRTLAVLSVIKHNLDASVLPQNLK